MGACLAVADGKGCSVAAAPGRRTKIATNSKDWEERNRALRNEKDIMSRHYQALKATMDRFRAAQADRLKTLSLSRRAAPSQPARSACS